MRKQTFYSETTIYPFAELANLRPDLIERVRKLAGGPLRNHPWVSMTDDALLDSAHLRQRDPQSGKRCLNLSAILLFGKDDAIISVLPHHRTEAILRRDNVDRYDDRDDIRTYLLDSQDRLLAFCEKHLKDPFYLEGIQRISLRGIIMREITANLLIHREYSQAFPAKLVIEKDRLFTENGNRPHGHGPIDPESFSPFPKNPLIARVFKEIGWADELGSGVRKLFTYSKAFGGHDPEMIEGDVFRLILPLTGGVYGARPETGEERAASEKILVKTSEKTFVKTLETTLSEKTPEETPVQTSEKTPVETSEKTSEKAPVQTSEKIVSLVQMNPKISAAEIAGIIGVSSRAVEMQQALKASGRIERVGPDKGGHWIVLKR